MARDFHIEDLGFDTAWGGVDGTDGGPDENYSEWGFPTLEEFFALDPTFDSDRYMDNPGSSEGFSMNGIDMHDWKSVLDDPDRRIQFMIVMALRQQNQILGRMYEAMLEANNINEKQANKEANDGN